MQMMALVPKGDGGGGCEYNAQASEFASIIDDVELLPAWYG